MRIASVSSVAKVVLFALTFALPAAAQNPIDLSRQARGLVVLPGAVLESPKTADSGLVQWKWPTAVAPQRVSCSVLGTAGESVTIQLELRTEAAPDDSGANVLTASLVCPQASSAVSTAFAVSSFPRNAPVALKVVAVSGAPKALRVYAETKSTETNH